MNEEKKIRTLEEEKLDKVTGGAYVVVDDNSGKSYPLIHDDDGPIGTYEVSHEGADDPNARSKSLGL